MQPIILFVKELSTHFCIINHYQSSETMMGIYHVCRFSVQIYSSGTRQIQNSVFIDYFCIIDSRLQHVLGVSSPTYSGAYNLPRDKRRIYCLNAEDVADIQRNTHKHKSISFPAHKSGSQSNYEMESEMLKCDENRMKIKSVTRLQIDTLEIALAVERKSYLVHRD